MSSTRSRLALARNAVTSVLVYVGVGFGVLVSAWAMRLVAIVSSHEIARSIAVFTRRDRSQVLRVHTPTIPAQVIKHEPLRHFSMSQLVAKTVRFVVLCFYKKLPIAAFVNTGRPQPATGCSLVHFRPELSLRIPRFAQAGFRAESTSAILPMDWRGADFTGRHALYFTVSA